ncbi:alpha-glucosidase-like [Lasioglossum baleicum]|uniref:alpha-glucosidase-like n=1 Tax=Lasioglossum baleicum TaxID=434251 RepID=UPI003FCDE6B5
MKTIILFCVMSLYAVAGHDQRGQEWWRTMSLYQIYPRSFKDSDGDGVGDLRGIISKLDHLVESHVDAFWVSPIYPSPMVDFGYDISNFTDIDPVFGTMEDFEELLDSAHNKNLKMIMDFVPNHSSNKHEWFQKSLENIKPYDNYYVWHEGKDLGNGTRAPPNNWVSVFGGPAWTWRPERNAYYFHQFAPEQPDLNYNNELLVKEMQDVLRFWLNKGVDGFRVDAIPHLCEDARLLDEPLTGHTDDPNNYDYTVKKYTQSQPHTYEIVKGWSKVLKEYKGNRAMMMEAYTDIPHTMKYFSSGASFPFNFGMITNLNENSTVAEYKQLIDTWMTSMPNSGTANWVAGNHDKSRLATRFGPERARAVTLMTLLLPGVSVTYNGDEIGMVDTWVSWKDTKDPQGCNAGQDGFETMSRDPARSPFQWDKTTSAGFSTNPKTWIPVNANYKTVNLETEKAQKDSYYNFYNSIAWLRKAPFVRKGSLVMNLLNKNVLLVARETAENGSVYAIVNLGASQESVDLSVLDNVSCRLNVYYSTVNFDLTSGSVFCRTRNLRVPPHGIVVFLKY